MSKNYILIHGAWHASWCWKYVAPLLIENGHHVLTPDLPGHGANVMPFADISLQTYLDYLSGLIYQCSTPVTLVGHSMAGGVISQLGENMPEKVQQLIYVTGYIPDDQTSLRQEAKKAGDRSINAEMLLDKAQHCVALQISERLLGLFYNACNPEDASFALRHLQPEPAQPLVDPMDISAAKFGQVPKRYITCLQDNIISPADQKRMYTQHGCEVITLEQADHSPFFSAPEQLVAAL